MTTQEIKNKILTDPKFVAEELQKLSLYYQLKHTLRWGFENDEEDVQESVAEHVYGMNMLSEYFLPLHSESCTNSQNVSAMILRWLFIFGE